MGHVAELDCTFFTFEETRFRAGLVSTAGTLRMNDSNSAALDLRRPFDSLSRDPLASSSCIRASSSSIVAVEIFL